MNELENKIRINGVKFGLVLGVIVTVLSLISYYFVISTQSPALFVAAPIFFSVFIPIFCVVFLCFTARKSIGGYWSFKQATTGIFVMFLVAYLIQFIAKDIVFDKVIEPTSSQKTALAAINAKQKIMQEKGMSSQAIDQETGKLKKDLQQISHTTIGGTIQGFVISILFVFLFALIFAALFKRDPVYAKPV